MNQVLYTFLGNLGHNQVSLDDRIRAYLLATVVSAAASDTTNDLWKKLGAQEGYAATDIQGIQLSWAAAQGSSNSASWNDALNGLP